MKRKLFLLILFIIIVLSWQCNSKPATGQDAADKQPLKSLPVYLIDSIEHLFGNENWQMIDGADTSYILLSRQNEKYIKIYHYKMSEGDSVNSISSSITFRADSVVWSQPGQELILQQAVGKEIDWKSNSLADTASVSFRQTEKDKIIFQHATKKIYMAKTITLSDFLVRSRYDFLHGTHYAFDTVKFHGPKKTMGKAVINNKN